jgi:uncharacterized protein YraI
MSRQGIGRRGSTLAAALALAFLVFVITTVSLARVAATIARVNLRHQQANALFLAEAGVRKAAHELMANRAYTGERGTRLPTGSFDVSVSKAGGGYTVTSTGRAASPFPHKARTTVRAVVTIIGAGSFRISDWREHP